MVLTEKGKATKARTDFERIRVRGFLREEMLHPLLRGRIFNYFAGDDLGTAVFEAFKTVEIEVRGADHYSEKEIGKTLMCKAFAPKGPLTKARTTKPIVRLWPGCLPRRSVVSGIRAVTRTVRFRTCSKRWKNLCSRAAC
jgi:hypothetical protein